MDSDTKWIFGTIMVIAVVGSIGMSFDSYLKTQLELARIEAGCVPGGGTDEPQ